MKNRYMLTILCVVMIFSNVVSQSIGDGWQFRKKIIMNTSASGADIDGDVEKYPLGVQLNADNFDFSQALTDGADIRFTDENDELLPYEIEVWDSDNSMAALWILVPEIAGGDDSQFIYLYWGKAGATSQSEPNSVFDTEDDWMGVWHLSEEGNTDEGGYKDATANQAHATGMNMEADHTVAGRIGMAATYNNPDKRGVRVTSEKRDLFYPPDKMTVSIWINAEDLGTNYQNIMSKGDVSWTVQQFGTSRTLGPCVKTPPYHFCAEFANNKIRIELGEWYLVTSVFEKPVGGQLGRIRLYINTTLDDEGSDPEQWQTRDDPVGIGVQNSGRHWDGILDEARVVAAVRDINWIKLDYESQREGQKLVTFGPVENITTARVWQSIRTMFNDSRTLKKVEIFSLNGTKVYEISATDWDTGRILLEEHLLRGMYLYRCEFSDGYQIRKVVRVDQITINR